MVTKLAEELYTRSILLKKYDNKRLLFQKKRLTLINELYDIQAQIHEIIRLLKDDHNYSIEYKNLAIFMGEQITEYISLLTKKEKNYRNIVNGMIRGFHNLPRAFFSLNNTMRISPAEAMEYYKTYKKIIDNFRY